MKAGSKSSWLPASISSPIWMPMTLSSGLSHVTPARNVPSAPVSVVVFSNGDSNRSLEVLGFAREYKVCPSRDRDRAAGSEVTTRKTTLPVAQSMMSQLDRLDEEKLSSIAQCVGGPSGGGGTYGPPPRERDFIRQRWARQIPGPDALDGQGRSKAMVSFIKGLPVWDTPFDVVAHVGQ